MLVGGNDDARYVVVFDPLDGSSNIDASIPTGEFCLPFLRFALIGLPLPFPLTRQTIYLFTIFFCANISKSCGPWSARKLGPWCLSCIHQYSSHMSLRESASQA